MLKRIIGVIVWLLITAGLIHYLAYHTDDLKRLIDVSAVDILLFFLFFIGLQLMNSLRIKIILDKKNIKLGIFEAFCLTNINTIANYLPMRAGMVATAFYFRHRYRLAFMDFARLLIAIQILLFITVTAATSILVVVHFLISGVFLKKVFLLFAAPLALILIAIYILNHVSKKPLNGEGPWQSFLKGVDGLRSIFSDKKLMFNLTLLHLGIIFIVAVRFGISFNIVSFAATPLLSLVAGQVKIIATLLSIVPAGLGIAEFFAGAVSELMGVGLNIGVYAASVDRIISVILLLILSPVSFGYIYHYIRPAKKA
jgi:uncharacterized membrane protein YbhN (UPF0104 family)